MFVGLFFEEIWTENVLPLYYLFVKTKLFRLGPILVPKIDKLRLHLESIRKSYVSYWKMVAAKPPRQ